MAANGAEFDLPAALALLPYASPFAPGFDFTRLPQCAGVFVLETGGEPFLGKSASLRRRLSRLLSEAAQTSVCAGGEDRLKSVRPRLNLRAATRAIHYQATGSVFETSLLLYRAARALLPGRYRELLRLRVPPLLKLNLDNPYPRCYVTRRLGRAPALYYGPFPSRAAAEKFAPQVLDLFLVRRCVEGIRPDPAHPGCIYGEMGMCLRPCQRVGAEEEYRREAERLAAFFSTGGSSLVKEIEGRRDRASAELNFEEAARLHKLIEKVREALRHRPDLAADLEQLHGLVIQASPRLQASGFGLQESGEPNPEACSLRPEASVMLFPVWRGFLQAPVRLALEVAEGKPISLDARLREALSAVEFRGGRPRLRAEHLALLARWYFRGTRKGEFVPIERWERIPFRRIVGAISRVVKQVSGAGCQVPGSSDQAANLEPGT
jgi:excinuclease ABC subunit C